MTTATLPRLVTAMNHAEDPRVLQTVALEGIAVAVWLRTAAPAYQEWLDTLPVDRLPTLALEVPAVRAADAISRACDTCGTQAGDARDAFVADVASIVVAASEALGTPRVFLRLQAAKEWTCPNWHVDAVTARVFATLRGPGTEFGPARPDGVPRRVSTLPTGAVAIFRGVLWPGNELSGIVHRSPDVPPGTVRHFLSIDPIDARGTC